MKIISFVFSILSTTQALARAVALPETYTLSILGQGVDTAHGVFRNACVQGDSAFRGNRGSRVKTEINLSAAETLRATSGEGDVSADVWVFGADASTEFSAKTAYTDLSQSFFFDFSFKSGTQVLDNAKLNAVGQGALPRGTLSIRKSCGDEYIDRVDVGGSLLLAITFSSNYAAIDRYFKTTVSVSALGGLLEDEDTEEDEFHDVKDDALLTISVYQRGGKKEMLNAITNKQKSLSCRFPDIQFCLQKGRELLAYAKNQNGFAAQFQNKQDHAVLSAHSSSYTSAGLSELATPSGLMSQTRTAIETLLGLQINWNAYLENSDIKKLDARDVQKIQLTLGKIQNALNVCRTAENEPECFALTNEITKTVR